MENLTYHFKPITYYDVLSMETWRYNGFEKCLYMHTYHKSHERGDNPLIGPEGSKGYAVFNNNGELFGLMEYYFEDDGVHLGLAINPLFIGRGLSKGFIHSGVRFLKDEFNYNGKILLEVDRRNIQAVKAYESAGFKFIRKNGNEIHYQHIK